MFTLPVLCNTQSHVVVTHRVWPVSIAFTLWFLLSLFCGVHNRILCYSING